MPVSVTYPSTGFNGIGNVSIATQPGGVFVMSNNSGLTYNYICYDWSVPAARLVMDSTYRFSMTDIAGTSGGLTNCPAVFFIDWNRNGIWDLPAERIMNKVNTATPQIIFQDVTVPRSTASGLTGLRAIHGYGISLPVDPCGSFMYNSECEDYLVYIEFPPCTGPVNAGTSFISDTSVCPGYTVDLWNTTYEQHRTGIIRTWEVSNNLGASYTAIANATNKDTLFNVVAPASAAGLRYRLRAICSHTGDTTYSNWLSVTNPNSANCYPFAAALSPGTNDSSDIGSFVIGHYENPLPIAMSGPHLGNVSASRGRTDYTHIAPIRLAADSVYRLATYHVMRSSTHADALVSVFIDFNGDGQYSEGSPGYPFPPELIYRGTTNATNYYLDTFFRMPATYTTGSTGMRVVLNNDLDPTHSGNMNGTGTFTSGEVEDYLVYRDNDFGISGIGPIQNLVLVPNPAAGKTSVVFDAARSINHLEMTVTNVTGQQIMSRSFDNVSAHFAADLDLTGMAKGMYLVELRADDAPKTIHKLVVQ
jgi:hypothetical protein